MRKFEAFTDDELDDIACAFDAAACEGALGESLVEPLCAEYRERDRLMPLAYSSRKLNPDDWKKQLP